MTRPPPSGPDDFDPTRPEDWPPPPEPSAEAWEKARTGIVARLPRRKSGRRRAVAVTAGGLIAAGVVAAWLVWPPTPTPPKPPEAVAKVTPVDPLAGYDVLPVATPSDVMVSAVRGVGVEFGSIDHPIPEVMPLATSADVIVHRGPAAGELCVPDPGGMAVYVMPPTDK
jgi:hypothetical protein